MSKERLEEIKDWYEYNSNNDWKMMAFDKEHIVWLIEQAEQVQELDKELDRVKVKYRESINLALNHIHTGNFNLATVALNKALLKEVEQ